ncbi:sortase domain-containing protein [Collinsella bouchesdurhonensis]|uniref:sortase domain-containing protein n=1 Tax=Collinsella bouchesdurhonensis TaxID=1907654 RepID=UPI001E2D5B3C|nr:sortase [Collinsella bouchesdurhonensis]
MADMAHTDRGGAMPGGRHVAGQSRVRMVKAGSHFASAPAASSATPDPKAAADAFEPAWTPRPVGARFATSPKAGQPSATQVAAQIAPKPVTLPTRSSTSTSNPSAWETAEFMRIAAARGTSSASPAGAVTANAASVTRAMQPIASPAAAPATVSRAAKQPALRTTASASSARAASQSPQIKSSASAPAEAPAFDPFAYHPEIAEPEEMPAHVAPVVRSASPATASAPHGAAAVTARIPVQEPRASQNQMTSPKGVAPVAVASTHRSSAKQPRPVRAGGSVPPRTPERGAKGGRGDNRPPRKQKQILPLIFIIVGIALLLIAGGLFIKAQLGYQEAQSCYKQLEQYAVKGDSGDDVPSVDFNALAQINPDIVGWIYVPGTVINYPVVQTSNNTTYLSRLFDASGNGSGTIFMDMDDTAPGLVDEQTTIYGHHMNDGSMFKAIDNTLNQEEFDKIGKVYYITRDTTYVLKPMFTAQVEDTYVDARRTTFEDSDKTLTAYLEDMLGQEKARSSTAGEDVKKAKQVLTLVTCAGEIIPRTTRAAMVCTVVEAQPRAEGQSSSN